MAVTIDAGALTTLATLKGILGITLADTSKDDRLTLAINAATAAISGFCNRTFARAEIVDERHPTKGGMRLAVDRPPLNSIDSIEYEDNTTALSSDEYLIEKARGGVIYFVNGLVRRAVARGGAAQDGQPGTEPPYILVSYDGGYITRQQTIEVGGDYEGETPTLPGDLESACLRYAVDLYNQTPTGTSEIASETLGDASVTYRDDDAEIADESEAPTLPPKVARMVKRYKRLAFV